MRSESFIVKLSYGLTPGNLRIPQSARLGAITGTVLVLTALR